MRYINLLILTLVITVSAIGQQSLKAGAAAPDFNGESLDGKVFNLNQLQGKIVVLTFWSTRCEICHNEIPKLNEVVKRYRDKDVVFLALTMENQVKVEPYLRKNPFSFSILPNSFGVFLKYADMDKGGNINMGFPSYFLINQHGAITLKSDGWDKTSRLDSQIQQMLASE
ncbi:MAG: TlpA disulfide reductase family protein [Pyrinomonadaceae bacterium]